MSAANNNLMNRKAKGARLERKSRALLESLGYICTRSAASLGLWDVVAISDREVLLIQIKSNRPCPRQELERFQSLSVATCVRKLIHVWRDFSPRPEVVEVSCT